jgi:hypothetical protein
MINRMDICMIQEHWLFNCQIQLLNEIHENLKVSLDASVSNIVSCCGGLSRIKNADEAGYLIGYNRLVDL